MPVQYDIMGVTRADVAWSPDDSQLVYLRNPRRGMCGEGDGRKVKGSALAVSNIDLTDNGIVDNPIDGCDEVAISTGRFPDWWRGALCGNGIVAGAEQCDDSNKVDGDGCSAVCMDEP